MDKEKKPYEFIDHTADITLQVQGDNLSEIFSNSAVAMTEYIFGPEVFSSKPESYEELKLESRDSEALLVDWLSELLYRTSTQYSAFVAIEILDFNEKAIVARLGKVKAEAKEDIKAVTFHELGIEKNGGLYQAKVTFDI